MVFYNSTVLIYELFSLRSAYENTGSSGSFNGSSASCLMIYTRISIGATTILSVSFDKTIDPTHIKTHVKIVIVNYYLAS
jgi:hypothetical protein